MDTFFNEWPVLFDSTSGLEVVVGETIKAILILTTALLVTLVWRGTSAATRYFILCLAVAGVLIMPFLSIAVSAWQPDSLSQIGLVRSISSFLPDFGQGAEPTLEGYGFMHWPALVIVLWLVGAAIMIMRLLAGTIGMRLVLKAAAPVEDVSVYRLLAACKGKLGVGRQVRLLKSKKVTVPFTCRWFRPTIVLPENSMEWSQKRLEPALLHELAHVKRWDVVTSGIALIASVLYWFNPLVWIALRRLYLERERACDDYVLCAGKRASEYADQLLKLSRLTNTRTLLSPVGIAMARRAYLKERIKSILVSNNHTTTVRLPAVILISLLTLTCTLLLACGGTRTPQPPDDDNGLFSSGHFVPLDSFPEMIYEEALEYPPSAKEAGLQGVVLINAFIDTIGDVQKAVVRKSSGYESLDNAALEAAKKNKFKPAQQSGKTIAIWVTYSVVFTLENDSSKT